MDNTALQTALGIHRLDGPHHGTGHRYKTDIRPELPLDLRSFSTFSQNSLPSCSPSHKPGMSFVPSLVMPRTT